MTRKQAFADDLGTFAKSLQSYASTKDGQWTIKGFIDVFRSVYTISSDTKIVSKILELHLLPRIREFAERHDYKVVLAEHQNYYPDISLVDVTDESIRFAVDIKSTYRDRDKPHLCHGFTLGSHGTYFRDRKATRNVTFPYGSYAGHYCLGVIYDRQSDRDADETTRHQLDELSSITSVAGNFLFFVAEKWKIASDKRGSGNTANIGSITRIDDIVNERGMFSVLGENWFDDYWINYGKISIPNGQGSPRKITKLQDFVEYRGGDVSKIVPKKTTMPEE